MTDIHTFPEVTDSYHFACTRCGNCCSGDQKVHLDLHDLYRLAGFMGHTHTSALFNSGVVILVKEEHHVYVPRIRFKRKPFVFCPFLENDYNGSTLLTSCRLHPDHKPLICHMAPLGRVMDFSTNEETFIFVPPAPDCPGVEKSTVNYVSDFKNKYTKELGYQREFFKLLEILKEKSLTRRQFLDTLYSFDVRQPFEHILQEKTHLFSGK